MKFAVFCIYMYIYGVICTENIYDVNYAQSNINQIEENPGFLYSFSQIPIYAKEPETNQKIIYV